MSNGYTTNCNHMAVGWWGRNIYRRILAGSQIDKEKTLLIDQVLAGGIRANLWQAVVDGTKCACYKESNRQADRKCLSCHGVGLVPGYDKFGYDEYFMSVVDSDVTLTNVEITKDFKSAKVWLSNGTTTGTIESGDKTFSRTATGAVWEYQASTFIRIAGQSNVVVEYSTDSGSSWNAMADLVTNNPVSGTIRFRATLTRTSTSVLSPLFEIVRARFARLNLANEIDGTYRFGPWILVMKSIPNRKYPKSEHGDTPIQDNVGMWTVGLSVFDSSIVTGSREELIERPNEEADRVFVDGVYRGVPKAIIEIIDGVSKDSRYVVTGFQASDPFADIITQQSFSIRYEDHVSPYSLLW